MSALAIQILNELCIRAQRQGVVTATSLWISDSSEATYQASAMNKQVIEQYPELKSITYES